MGTWYGRALYIWRPAMTGVVMLEQQEHRNMTDMGAILEAFIIIILPSPEEKKIQETRQSIDTISSHTSYRPLHTKWVYHLGSGDNCSTSISECLISTMGPSLYLTLTLNLILTPNCNSNHNPTPLMK